MLTLLLRSSLAAQEAASLRLRRRDAIGSVTAIAVTILLIAHNYCRSVASFPLRAAFRPDPRGPLTHAFRLWRSTRKSLGEMAPKRFYQAAGHVLHKICPQRLLE